MSFLFSKPKYETASVAVPQIPTVTMPTVPSTDVAATAEEEKKKLTQGRTKRSTLLTGPRGILTKAPVQLKTLLGE